MGTNPISRSEATPPCLGTAKQVQYFQPGFRVPFNESGVYHQVSWDETTNINPINTTGKY